MNKFNKYYVISHKMLNEHVINYYDIDYLCLRCNTFSIWVRIEFEGKLIKSHNYFLKNKGRNYKAPTCINNNHKIYCRNCTKQFQFKIIEDRNFHYIMLKNIHSENKKSIKDLASLIQIK